MSSVSSPEALESLISNAAPVKKKLITFVALALIVLNVGHAFDSIRLAISSAQRMEINSYLIEIQAIRDRLEHKYTETRATLSSNDRRAADEFLERLRQEDYLDQLKISSPSLLRVSFGQGKHASSGSLSDEQEQAVLEFLSDHGGQNTLPATDGDGKFDDLDQFVFADVGADKYLMAQTSFLEGEGQLFFAKKSIGREVVFWNAVRSSMAFAAVLFWLGIWFAILVGTFVARRINQSNAAIKAALRSRDKINEELEDIVSKRTKALESAKLEAEAASRVKGAFLANMSHEIRTPMNGVLGMAELMARSDLTEDQRRQLQMITNSSETLLRILDDILDISKIEAGQLQIENTTTKIRDLAETISMTMVPEADKRNVRLSLIFSPDVPEELDSDPVRLRQIFYNLLSNAIKFSESSNADKPGKVLFKIDYLDGDILKFRVADNGIGISADQAKSLFEPFSQAEVSTTRRFGGSGLGLSITKNLVDLLGGSIELESTVGKGTTFTVTIPSKKLKAWEFSGGSEPINLYFLTDREKALQSGDGLSWFFEPAHVCEFPDEAELRSAILTAKDRVVVVLGLSSIPENLAARRRLIEATGCENFILLTEDRSARFGLHPDGYYVATRYPVLYSELERALCTLLRNHEAQPVDKEETCKDSPKALQTEETQDHKKVLLVEDNEINVIVMSKQLELLGFAPEVARNGREGLQKWKSGNFDLVITDCNMPEMDGFELTREIRDAEKAECRTPSRIIAITANAMDGEAEKWQAAGANGYLTKPTTLDALQEAILVSGPCKRRGT